MIAVASANDASPPLFPARPPQTSLEEAYAYAAMEPTNEAASGQAAYGGPATVI